MQTPASSVGFSCARSDIQPQKTSGPPCCTPAREAGWHRHRAPTTHQCRSTPLILSASDLQSKSLNAPSELLYRQSNTLYTFWCVLSFRVLPRREGRQDDWRQSKLTAVFCLPKWAAPPEMVGRAAPDCEPHSESRTQLHHCWVGNRCAIPRAFSNLIFFYICIYGRCVHKLTFCKSVFHRLIWLWCQVLQGLEEKLLLFWRGLNLCALHSIGIATA